MLVVLVTVQVKPEAVEEFLAATVDNATHSRDEPGVLRFDVLQDQADPTHVTLVEVYRDIAATVAHKETDHYERWRDAVADLMAQPRSSQKFDVVDPVAETAWAAGTSDPG